MPHGVATDKVIGIGDFVTIDFGCRLDGYCSDMTRTILVGKCSDRQREIYETVLKAQTEAIKAIKPGVRCADIDAVARNIITEAGFGDKFGHSLGHSVGIEIHEKPALSLKNDKKLQRGNIVTIEPGIYIPGKFGVRIEDLALITEKSCENLTKITKELVKL
jgi:Xaa-Pro aminopeptidase